MRLIAFSKSNEIENCKFFDSNDCLLYYSKTEKSEGLSKTNIFDVNGNLVSSVSYADSKGSKPNSYVIEISGRNLVFSFDQVGDLVCDEDKLRVKRVFLDKWFNLLKDENRFCSVRSFTFIKDWLSAKYTVDVLNVDETVLCVSLCVMKFISLYEAAIFSTPHYFSKI